MSHPRRLARVLLPAALTVLLGACASTLDDREPAPVPAWEMPDTATPEAREELQRGLDWIVQDAAGTDVRRRAPAGRALASDAPEGSDARPGSRTMGDTPRTSAANDRTGSRAEPPAPADIQGVIQ